MEWGKVGLGCLIPFLEWGMLGKSDAGQVLGWVRGTLPSLIRWL